MYFTKKVNPTICMFQSLRILKVKGCLYRALFVDFVILVMLGLCQVYARQ